MYFHGIKYALLLISVLLVSCASTHNMKDGGEGTWGGGFLVEPVSDGVFRIIAKTNVAQWSAYGTARRMWKKHAEEACQGKEYTELDVKEYAYEKPVVWRTSIESLFFRYIITVKEGLAVCAKEN
ncbi:MAG: hypothetical protein ABW072_17505 [Sedimenticola sp.]